MVRQSSAKVSAARLSDAAISFMVLNFPTHTKAKHNDDASSLLITLFCRARQYLSLCRLCRGKWKVSGNTMELLQRFCPRSTVFNSLFSLHCGDLLRNTKRHVNIEFISNQNRPDVAK